MNYNIRKSRLKKRNSLILFKEFLLLMSKNNNIRNIPEEIDLIDLSLLIVFRRERLRNKDNETETSTNLLDKLVRIE